MLLPLALLNCAPAKFCNLSAVHEATCCITRRGRSASNFPPEQRIGGARQQQGHGEEQTAPAMVQRCHAPAIAANGQLVQYICTGMGEVHWSTEIISLWVHFTMLAHHGERMRQRRARCAITHRPLAQAWAREPHCPAV